MILKIIVVAIEVMLSYLLQTAVFSGLGLADVVPDIVMIVVASNGIMFGRNYGSITGFFCGLILDLTFGSLIGMYALIYTVLGFITGFANRIYNHNDYTIPLFVIGGAEFLYNALYYFFFYILKGRIEFGHFLVRYLCPRVIYTVVVSVVLYRLMNFTWLLFRKMDLKKKDRAESVIEYDGLDVFFGRDL